MLISEVIRQLEAIKAEFGDGVCMTIGDYGADFYPIQQITPVGEGEKYRIEISDVPAS